jgi:hypothetical protein
MLVAGHICRRNKSARPACTRCQRAVFPLVMGACFCLSPAALGQSPDSNSDGQGKSWTALAESRADNINPTRTFQTHTESGNRTVDLQSLQRRGPDGNLQPYRDIETETVRANATLTHTITRTFVRDGNGTKTLFQITEEETHILPGGDSKVVRTTSNPDANGRLQFVRREVQETHKTSPDVEETKTTVLLNVNGELAPAIETQERQQRRRDTVEIQKTTLLSDGAGSWNVGEVRQTTIKDEGKNRSIEERISRPDPDGKLGEVMRTVGNGSENPSGEKRNSEETYSIDVPGTARDSSLHLVERVTTTEHASSGSRQTTKLTERPNPGDPGAGLRISTVTTDTVHSGPFGEQAIRTTQMRNANGSLGVVLSVDMTKSNGVQAIQVQIAPSHSK